MYIFFFPQSHGGVPVSENTRSIFGGETSFMGDEEARDRLDKLMPTHVSRALGAYTVMLTTVVTNIPGTVFVLFLGKNPIYDTLVFGWISFESD